MCSSDLLAILIVGVFTAVAVTGGPRHYLRHRRAFPAEQKPVLILEALQPARRYVVLAWRSGLVRFRFSGKPFSHLVVLPAQIQWVPPLSKEKSTRCRIDSTQNLHNSTKRACRPLGHSDLIPALNLLMLLRTRAKRSSGGCETSPSSWLVWGRRALCAFENPNGKALRVALLAETKGSAACAAGRCWTQQCDAPKNSLQPPDNRLRIEIEVIWNKKGGMESLDLTWYTA